MLNIIDRLSLQAKNSPHNTALIYGDNSHSFLELNQLVKNLAKKLSDCGIKPGHIVSTRINNPFLHTALTFALFHEATISCSVAFYLDIPPEIKVDFFLVDPENFNGTIPKERLLLIDENWIRSALSQNSSQTIKSYLSMDSICRLTLSSGTTGEPKAIPTSQIDLVNRCLQRLSREPQVGCELSFFDVCSSIGLYAVLKPLFSGLPQILPYSYEQSIIDLDRLKISSIGGSPSHLQLLIEQIKQKHPNYLESITIAGSSVGEKLIRQIQHKLTKNIISRYGSSETSTMAWCGAEDLLKHPGAAGYPLPENQLEIVNDTFESVGPNEIGLIRVKTPYMSHQYYNNPQATNECFSDGWFYPGDLGYLKEDGLLILKGRKHDVINLGGVKINPNTIDHIVSEKPGVIECATVGVANDFGIDELYTAVVLSYEVNLENLSKQIINQLQGVHKTTKLIQVQSIPRNATGKILRSELRSQVEKILM